MCRKTFHVVSVVIDSAAAIRYAAYQKLSGAFKRFGESVSQKLTFHLVVQFFGSSPESFAVASQPCQTLLETL